MGEQILRVNNGGTVHDIAVLNEQGNWSVLVFDESTNALLTSILAQLDDATTDTVLSTLKNIYTDSATEATLSTRASETTLETFRQNFGNVDFATQTTLAAVLSQLDDATADTVLSVLKSLLTELGTQQKNALTDAELRASNVVVSDSMAHTKLDSILGQLDDATTDTVIGVLKSLLTELEQKTETADLQTDALTDIELRATDVEVNDDVAQTLLTTVRDEQYRRTDPLPAGGNRIGYVTDSILQRVQNAQTFIAGAHRISISSGAELWLVIQNPSTSGKNLILAGVTAYTGSSGTVWLDIFKDTEPSGTATAVTPWGTNFIAADLGVVSSMSVSHDGTVTATGTQLDAGSSFSSSSPWKYGGMPMLLGPGQGGGARVQVPGGLTGGADISINFIYVEEPQ